MSKQPLNFFQLANMSVGFLGIQFGWGLQMANTSAIFEYLGAQPSQIPILWLAAPVTGLFVQPVIGALSDRTWGPLGRRRPYFLGGAIAASLALVAMPNAYTLWMVAGALWVLDTAANVSMEPFRAFVSDILPKEQHTQGYAMQSLFIGLGSVLASCLPWLLSHCFILPAGNETQAIPAAVKLSFYIGAAVFLGTVLWTVLTTQEYPPEDLDLLQLQQKESAAHTTGSIFLAFKAMPATMQQLAVVQFFSWIAMFCIFLYFPTAIAHHIFNATERGSPLYTAGIEWAGLCLAVADASCCLFSFLLPRLTSWLSQRVTHACCLILGSISLISLAVISNQYWLLLPMVGFGIAKSSILSIPYSILTQVLPQEKTGIYMGIFNIFIVIPQIIASLSLGWVMAHWLNDNQLHILTIAGGMMLVSSIFCLRVEEETELLATTLSSM